LSKLTLEKVCKSFGEVAVLRDVDLVVAPGETVAIVGPSGSGKSTLLNVVGSLETPSSGTVRFGEIDVCALAGKALSEYRAAKVGLVFQEHHLLPQLNAVENVLLPSLALGGTASEGRARELLQAVGVAHRADAFPAEMSGGERQRVAIARALVNEPEMLLCDEPTGSLDQDTGRAVVDLLLEVVGDRGATVLMVTHNVEHAARFSRVLRLTAGRLQEDPPASSALDPDRARASRDVPSSERGR
jgi:ABC-type lipoprotein export system ATPase subunit